MRKSIALKTILFATIVSVVSLHYPPSASISPASPSTLAFGAADEAREAMLPANLIDLGSGGSFALLVNKADSRIDVYQQLPDSSIARVKSFRTSTGQVPGNKLVEGDLKTPEGVYYLTRIREDAELMSKYGLRAFDLNYPNEFDRLDAKTGHGIWLHGTDEPSRLRDPRTSEGCVVVSNEDIAELGNYIRLFRTPIVIEDNPSYLSATERDQLRARINNFILRWLDAWANQDIERYAACYSESFRGGSGRRAAWKAQKKQVFANTSWATVDIDDLKILRDEERYLVGFYQRYRSNLMDDTGIKWVYLGHTGDELQILSEEWFPVGKALSGQKHYAGRPSMRDVLDDLREVAVDPGGKLAIASPRITLPFRIAEAKGEVATAEPSVVHPTPREEAVAVETRATVKPRPIETKTPVSPRFTRASGKSPVEVASLKIASLDRRNLIVEFSLINRDQDGTRRRGWIYLVAEWSNSARPTAFPAVRLTDGKPQKASAGDYYGIKWGKEVRASLERPAADAELRGITAYIFDQKGRLLSDEQVSLNRQEANR